MSKSGSDRGIANDSEAVVADRNPRKSTCGGRRLSWRRRRAAARQRSCVGRRLQTLRVALAAPLYGGRGRLRCCTTRRASPAKRRCPSRSSRNWSSARWVRRRVKPRTGPAGRWPMPMGLAISTVQKIWRAHGLAPHRLRTFKLSRDPQFAAKVHDVVGLYLAPPAHSLGALGGARRARSRRSIAPSRACR